MNATHTPRPWKADCNPRHIIGCGRDIARVFGRFEDAEADANARLIAAAPELLKACQDMLDILRHEHRDPNNPETGLAYPMEVEAATRAIAKATGEQP